MHPRIMDDAPTVWDAFRHEPRFIAIAALLAFIAVLLAPVGFVLVSRRWKLAAVVGVMLWASASACVGVGILGMLAVRQEADVAISTLHDAGVDEPDVTARMASVGYQEASYQLVAGVGLGAVPGTLGLLILVLAVIRRRSQRSDT